MVVLICVKKEDTAIIRNVPNVFLLDFFENQAQIFVIRLVQPNV
jgi:hypothetical protein